MTGFDPLGPFDVNAPINKDALRSARVFCRYLPMVALDDISRVYLHQSAEAYGCIDGSYNAVIALVDGAWEIAASHTPRDNARSTLDADYARHTYYRNTGAVGIAINGLDTPGASPTNFGRDPIQLHSIEFLCAGAAAYCSAYGIDSLGVSYEDDPYKGEHTILTHAEAANLTGSPPQYDRYGPAPLGTVERWDLATLVQAPSSVLVTSDHASIVGDALRERIHKYKLNL